VTGVTDSHLPAAIVLFVGPGMFGVRVTEGILMAKLAKLDLYKKYRTEYITPKEPVFVRVGPAQYLSITGHGAPGGEHFREHVSALYSVAFTLKMAEKFSGHDYRVCHLEGQWWTADGPDFRCREPKEWEWRLLIRVPEFIHQKQLDAAIASVMAKGKAVLARYVRLEKLSEGRCVQMLHVGPYTSEKSDLDKMHAMAAGQGLHLRGPHHEIYLSDPRRVPEERLKTILRYPVE
jgi:hypothetical protein